MNLYHSCISVLLICVSKEVSPLPTQHWTHHWTCPSDTRYRYNLCHDPAHPDKTFKVESNTCAISSEFKTNMRRQTLESMDDLREEITDFETEHLGCDLRIQQLQRENLTRILGIESTDRFESQNPVTKIYFKMARYLRLFHKLWCSYSSRAEQECCLPFSRTFNKLKHRLLSKWWFVQNSCGQAIDQSSCDETVPVFTNNNGNLSCEELRYIIYILLQDARTLLNESLLVAEQI